MNKNYPTLAFIMLSIVAISGVLISSIEIGSGDGTQQLAAAGAASSTPAGYDIIIVAGGSNALGMGMGSFSDPYASSTLDARIVQLGRYGTGNMKPISATWQADATTYDMLQHWNVWNQRQTMGLAVPFARRYAAEQLAPARTVLIVPVAHNSSSIFKWFGEISTPTTTPNALYDDMVTRVNAALALPGENRVVAVLWHQGEADVGISPDAYKEKLGTLLARLRTDFPSYPPYPIIAGNLPPAWKLSKKPDARKNFESALAAALAADPRGAVASTSDLVSNYPSLTSVSTQVVNFTSASLVTLGDRYYELWEDVRARPVPPPPTPEEACAARSPLLPSADISSNLQAQIDCMAGHGGGKITLPAGILRISAPIKLKSRVWIVGSGDATILQTKAGAGLEKAGSVLFHSKDDHLEGASLQRFRIDASETPRILVFYIEDARYNIFDRISVSGATQGTIYMANPQGRLLIPKIGLKLNNYANVFSNISSDASKFGIVLQGRQNLLATAPDIQSAVTLNSYRNLRFDGITGVGVSAISWSDSENFDSMQLRLATPTAIGLLLRTPFILPGIWIDASYYQFAQVGIGLSDPSVGQADAVRFFPRTGGFSFLGLSLGKGARFKGDGALSYFVAGQFARPAAAGTCNALDLPRTFPHEVAIAPIASSTASAAIQEGIDSLAGQGGGVVRLAAGVYEIDTPLVLRDNVRVEGNGFATILKPAGAKTIFTSPAGVTGASVTNLEVDAIHQPVWAFDIMDPQGVYIGNILGLHAHEGGALRIRTTRTVSGNCFENITFSDVRGGISINDDAGTSPDAALTLSEFRGIKFLWVSELGIGVLRRAADNIFSDLVIWNSAAKATSIMVGSPFKLEGDADFPGRSVLRQTFYHITETMEAGGTVRIDGVPIAAADSNQSIGTRFNHTGGHALLGVFYTNWHWKNPIIAFDSDNLTIMSNVSESLRGSTDWVRAMSFPMSGLYEYRCTDSCAHPLTGTTTKGIDNLGDKGLQYMP